MSEYNGMITLTQLLDSQANRGIEKILTYYAISLNGNEPPEDGSITASIEDGVLSIRDQDDNPVFDYEDKNKVEVIAEKFFFVEGDTWRVLERIWQETIPSGNIQGYYFWTKMVIVYTDGEQEENYTVNYVGKDGLQGEPGQPGKDAKSYLIETNQEEILIFRTGYGSKDKVFSPNKLTFKIYEIPKKNNSNQLEIEDKDYTFEYQQNQSFVNVPREYLQFGEKTASRDEDSEDEEITILDEKTVYFDVDSFFENHSLDDTPVFRFGFIVNEEVVAYKFIASRLGVQDDMAKLSLNAADITASIQDGKLRFDESGLSLYKDEDKVFYVGSQGDAYFKGTVYATSGEFSGELKAATGSFSGSIDASSGKIGGFVLEKDSLYSISNGEDSTSSDLILNGVEGTIYAKNITIGSGAVIEDHVSLGEAKILNPKIHEGLILESGEIKLSQNGVLSIGSILINGDNKEEPCSISAGDETSSNHWKISGDGTARFNEIVANKATIQNSVMEIGSVQAVGSLMLFKDSWKVKSVNGNQCSLELTLTDNQGQIIAPPLSAGDYVLVNNIHYQIESIDETNFTLTLKPTCSFSKGDVLTKIGKKEDYLITIQGDSNQSFLQSTKNSLTLSSFEMSKDEIPIYTKKLVLGNLDDIEGASGTGLYAENVFLNGSLITRSKDQSAGINTLSKVAASKFEGDKSNIVIWAGAKGTKETDLKEAKFQVTENGSIYAASGVFEGSIISKSLIKGATIHTAKIYGEDESGKRAALEIYDASKGISFMKTIETTQGIETTENLLTISSNGLYKGETSFIKLEEDIGFLGNQLTLIDKDSEWRVAISEQIDFKDPKKNEGSIFFEGGFGFKIGDTTIIDLKKDEIVADVNVILQKNLQIGEKEQVGTIEYKKVEGQGYDLYVR